MATFVRGGPALVNHPELSQRADALLTGLEIPVAAVPFRSCGSDDFSEYGQVVPSLMSFIGVGSEGGVGLHHPKFLPGRSALRLSAETLGAGGALTATIEVTNTGSRHSSEVMQLYVERPDSACDRPPREL